MDRRKKLDYEREKISDGQSDHFDVRHVEKGIIARFRSALIELFSTCNEPAIKLTEEEESQIRISMIKCSDTLRTLHDKADAQFTGPVFERIDRSGRMEEEYLVYDDVKEYMIYNCETDLTLWRAFELYLSSINCDCDAEEMFIHSGDFAAVINIFGAHPRICSEVFMLIFKGNLEKARTMLGCSQMPDMNSKLGLSIVAKLLEKDTETIKLFLELIRQLPKKFLTSESRVDLLIEFASRHRDRAGQTNGKEAAEFIIRNEGSVHPYR